MDRSHVAQLSLVPTEDDVRRLATCTDTHSDELLVLAQLFASRARVSCERLLNIIPALDDRAEAITHF